MKKEALSIVEALRKWNYLLAAKHFTIITDQKSVSFMFDARHSTKIKNDKILRWRLELSAFSFDIIYRPGEENVAADSLSRDCNVASANLSGSLKELHERLIHPGVRRMIHFVRERSLPYSIDEIRKITHDCRVCSKIKPQFFKGGGNELIRAMGPFDRISIDFKGPLPKSSKSSSRYLLTIIDEYSRFPFAYPCTNVDAPTVIQCLQELFSIFGTPQYVHSDRGGAFMSSTLRNFLIEQGVATSNSTPYHPTGNSQVERCNGTVWTTVLLALENSNLPIESWEYVLPDALHAIRSLLCTSTNATPHERLFKHNRRVASGSRMPNWLCAPGPLLLRRYNRASKFDSGVDLVELIQSNQNYAKVRFPDGREDTVSTGDLAPAGLDTSSTPSQIDEPIEAVPGVDGVHSTSDSNIDAELKHQSTVEEGIPRRSSRIRREPDRLQLNFNRGRLS